MIECHISCKNCSKINDPMSCTQCYNGFFIYSEDYHASEFQCIPHCEPKKNIYPHHQVGIRRCRAKKDNRTNYALIKQDYTQKLVRTTISIALPASILPKTNERFHSEQNDISIELSVKLAILIFLLIIMVVAFLKFALLVRKRNHRQNLKQRIRQAQNKDAELVHLTINEIDTVIKKSSCFKQLEIIDIHRFSINDNIGYGGFSLVYNGKLDGKNVAVKVALNHGRKSIHAELRIYDKIFHPNILPAIGVHFGLSNILFMPLRKYSLLKLFEKHGSKIGAIQLTSFCIQVADAMKYLHNNKILHCDLKAGNVLIKDNCGESVEISDFGCGVDLSNEPAPSARGTITHLSYELLQASFNQKIGAKCSEFSDVWAYAVTTWEIFSRTNKLPDEFQIEAKIIQNYNEGKHLNRPLEMPEYLWRYVILQCFDLMPDSRPKMDLIHKKFVDFHKAQKKLSSSSSSSDICEL